MHIKTKIVFIIIYKLLQLFIIFAFSSLKACLKKNRDKKKKIKMSIICVYELIITKTHTIQIDKQDENTHYKNCHQLIVFGVFHIDSIVTSVGKCLFSPPRRCSNTS